MHLTRRLDAARQSPSRTPTPARATVILLAAVAAMQGGSALMAAAGAGPAAVDDRETAARWSCPAEPSGGDRVTIGRAVELVGEDEVADEEEAPCRTSLEPVTLPSSVDLVFGGALAKLLRLESPFEGDAAAVEPVVEVDTVAVEDMGLPVVEDRVRMASPSINVSMPAAGLLNGNDLHLGSGVLSPEARTGREAAGEGAAPSAPGRDATGTGSGSSAADARARADTSVRAAAPSEGSDAAHTPSERRLPETGSDPFHLAWWGAGLTMTGGAALVAARWRTAQLRPTARHLAAPRHLATGGSRRRSRRRVLAG